MTETGGSHATGDDIKILAHNRVFSLPPTMWEIRHQLSWAVSREVSQNGGGVWEGWEDV